MSLSEFDLIKHFFKDKTPAQDSGVVLGMGDDCAILDVPDGYQLAVSTDTLVCDVHFFADVSPYRLGYKALAVNLSDLAAMGATPKWASLAITLPEVNTLWLAEFSRGFFELANQFNLVLVGGDTTKGPLSITISIKGIVPRAQALQRSGAVAGDLICVSGCIGDGALGLASKLKKISLGNQQAFIDALEWPQPRIELGVLLRGLGSSCIDISDGLTQDLRHILQASHCSAELDVEKLPLSAALKNEIKLGAVKKACAFQYALTGGDDYELLFTISADNLSQLHKLRAQANSEQPSVTVIGTVIGTETLSQQAVIEVFENRSPISFALQGWDHFK